jgi:hypothetical protein
VKRRAAHVMRRAARALIAGSNRLDPPVVKSAAEQGLEILNGSLRRLARDIAYDAERAEIDAWYVTCMAMLR